MHLSHEGFGLLRVRNSGAAPITYRVNLAGVDAGAGAFEFSSEWITQPAGVTLALRTLPGSPGFQREVDANNDGTPESIDALPARGALRAGRDGGLLALRWRPSATDETLENTADLTTPNWTPNGASVSNDGADRVANVATAGPAQFFRVKPAGTNCLSPAAFGTGLFPNPWETTAFKFEALTASGTMRPHNEILTRSGATGLDVFHTVRIHPQDDCRVLHIEVRQTSGSVRFEAVGALGGVIARAELVGPGTGLQRVTLRGARDRIHFVRVISPNALCLIVNVCAEREAQTVVQPSCLNFESLTPDFLNSPAPFGLFEITGHYGPLTIEPVPGLAVNGLLLPGNNSPHTSFRITPSFGTAQRVTIRLVCPDGGVSIQAYNSAGAVVGNSDGAGASPEPQTLSLAVAGMARFDIFVPNIASAHLLEICVERDPLP